MCHWFEWRSIDSTKSTIARPRLDECFPWNLQAQLPNHLDAPLPTILVDSLDLQVGGNVPTPKILNGGPF
jgi:hypothetical protein